MRPARRSFAEHSAGVQRMLGMHAYVTVPLLAGWEIVSRDLLETPPQVPVLAILLGPLVGSLFVLASWSLRSHTLAVEHGMIPRWSAYWAQLGWLLPVVDLFVPFQMLRERWRFYRCPANRISPTTSAQVLLLLALALLALLWWSPRTPVLPSACCGIWFFRDLRRVVRVLAEAQVEAERRAHAERVFG